ncbi:hypothetical protein ACNR9V_20695 (plasmid) [Parageobacillus thermoglucosidasius]|uniref:hypothetical protein n=1 Tax=Parageobacillus thermoglucosidasius TaxID=1426 RepID=UPI003B6785EA
MPEEQTKDVQVLTEEISSLVEVLQQQQEQQQKEQQKTVEEQKKEAELQKKEEQVTQKTLQLLEEQNKNLQTLVQTFSADTTTEETTQILQKLDEISSKMDGNKQIFVEASWMIVISIVIAVGLKLFWDNVLKW